MNYLKEHTPKGFLIVKHEEGPISPGATAKGNPFDWLFEGIKGTFLGWSLPHGFAVVAHGETEDCFHPDSLEVVS